MKNKKGMAVSLVLLVLLTLVLSSFTLFTFYSGEKSIQGKLYTTRFLENLYAEEEIINFYVQDIFDKSEGITVEEFIDSFKEELNKYKINNEFIVGELAQVEEQIDDAVEIENNKVIAEFKITIKDEVIVKGEKIFSASYTYNKKFEKEV